MKGDGDSDYQRYSTVSLELAKGFQRLIYHLGLKGFVYNDKTRGFKIFRIQINKKRGIKPYLSKYRNFSFEEYKGKVYCVEVPPYHTIIAGRNYKLNVCGQSFFGVMANPMCRFYSIDIANAITHWGQFIVKKTAEIVEKKGFRVIYGDTDSIFVETKSNNIEDAESNGNEIQLFVNKYWKKYTKKLGVNNFLELQFEKTFIRFMMPKIRGTEKGAKKRYAGLLIKDGKEKIDFTGLEFVRRDWTAVSKKFQLELLDKIFHKQEVVEYIRKFVDDLLNSKYDDLLVYKKAIRKDLKKYVKITPPHVKAARKLDKLTNNIISYVITTDGPEPLQNLKHKLDYDHYIQKQIKPIADSVLVFYDKNFDDLLLDSKQTNLFGFN